MISLAAKGRSCLIDDIKCLEAQLSALQERFDIIVNWIRSQYCELNGLPHIVIVAVLGDKGSINEPLESTSRETFPLADIEHVKVECDNFDESFHVNTDCKVELHDPTETSIDKMNVDVLTDSEIEPVSSVLSVASVGVRKLLKVAEDDLNHKNEQPDVDKATVVATQTKKALRAHPKGTRVVVKKTTSKHFQDNKEKGLILTAAEYKELIASLPELRQSCVVCGKEFPSMPRLRRHEEVHLTDEDAKQCRKDLLNSRLEASKSAVKRTKREPQFVSAIEYKELIAPLPKQRQSCAICHKDYPMPVQLRRHELECHLTKEEREKFRNDLHPGRVVSKTNVRKTPQCLEANREKGLILTAGDYKELIDPLPTDRLTCAICSRDFPTPERLRRHELAVHLTKEEARKFRSCTSSRPTMWVDDVATMCDLCNFPFKDIELHKKNHLPPGVTTKVKGSSRPHYRCLTCDSLFTNKTQYLSHIATSDCKEEETPNNDQRAGEQHTEKNFLCNKCGQSFNRMYTLKVHELAVHANKRDFKCKYCDKRFVIEYTKKCHEKRHLGTSSVTCDLCGFSFRGKQILRKHIRGVHENRRPYQCSLCDKSFKTSTARNYHLNTHGNTNGRQRSLNRDVDPMHAARKRRRCTVIDLASP